jgi:two-component system cell cycle response regulator
MRANLAQIRSLLWSRPDPVLAGAGGTGEMLVARIRLLLTAVLLLIPVVNNLVFSLSLEENLVGFSVTFTAFLLSAGVYILIARGFNPTWLGFATSCFDVTLVSGALAIFLLFNEPHTAVNSKVIFEGYFLAIGATSLRYDQRVCFTAGVLALGEYLGIVAYAAAKWDLNNAMYAPFPYGMFSWTAQISRLILMLTAFVLSMAIVSRTQKLLRLATSDPLTGLFNRGYLDDRIASDLSRASRYRQPLTIAMIDVDLFKSFNDSHGHAAGDAVLRTIAAKLRLSFRQSDTVGRYGGEEFVVMMPETDIATARGKLESLRAAIAETPIQISKLGETVGVTISAGLAGFPVDGAKQGELLGLADARLFQAKRDGRNQVVSGIKEMAGYGIEK